MSKNSTTLATFTDYCKQHPEERFWQALQNWSKSEFLIIINKASYENIDKALKGFDWYDTFYKEDDK